MAQLGSSRKEAEDDGTAAAASAAMVGGLVGLATTSMAVVLAARQPPPRLDKTAYFLALAGAFYAGVAEVVTAVWVSNDPRGRRGVGRKLMYASVGPLAVAVGLSVASLLWVKLLWLNGVVLLFYYDRIE
ncbi:hypothetical protein ACP70R_030453 [Stipagrostis hirtigluma subsp. patula]